MRDLDDATRGLTAALAELSVKSADGKQVCDTGRSSFITGEALATVGPSLWRMERLNSAAVL
jgi:alkyl sulfatase BDS1-like metallo-beta-lactamase superfamily hydrolase